MKVRTLLVDFCFGILLVCIDGTSSRSMKGDATSCRSIPGDSSRPRRSAWATLNETINGRLIKTSPIAASCYPASIFNSPLSCSAVTSLWTSFAFHASTPEGIGYSHFANNSCTPPSAPGDIESGGQCQLGGYPVYVVNATCASDVAAAVSFAREYNIRLVIKNSGHDFLGRSTGAHSLSIWTRHLLDFEIQDTFVPSGCINASHPVPEEAVTVGSGWPAVPLLEALAPHGKVAITGGDPTVGLGGYLSGGGHSLLSSWEGLGSDQILEVQVVTADGSLKIVNQCQNQDLYWALKGGGPSNYGVVVSYTVKTYSTPSIIASSVSIAPTNNSPESSAAALEAIADLFTALPDLNDAGVAGYFLIFNMSAGTGLFGPSVNFTSGPVLVAPFLVPNGTINSTTSLFAPFVRKWESGYYGSGLVTGALGTVGEIEYTDFPTFNEPMLASDTGILSSRLLPKESLQDRSTIASFMKQLMVQSNNDTEGGFLLAQLVARDGVAKHSSRATGCSQSYLAECSSSDSHAETAAFLNAYIEPLLHSWAPVSGAYMNEANPYAPTWKEDFFGESYERLLGIKRKYDPDGVFWARVGVGSDGWEESIDGRLCLVQ